MDADDNDLGDSDPYVNMELAIMRDGGEEVQHAMVKRRAVDNDGKPIGVSNNRPFLDSRLYEVEFLDGTTEVIAANIIAENLLSQVDEEGHRQMMLSDIFDHRKSDSAIPMSEGTFKTHTGATRRKITTLGWEICVLWKDGSTDWVALKDLKQSYPVHIAEYAIRNEIENEPAFAWWVPYTIRKEKRILSKIKTKYWQRTHKYGIRLPRTIREAELIDIENKNHMWKDAIRDEMKEIILALEEYNGDPKYLIGYQEITCHMIFDIKLTKNFRRIARFVADGHKTETPASVTYSTVVTRDSVRLIFLLATLNDLDLKGADIKMLF